MDRKKQLKLEYKNRKPLMGVFAVTCTPTNTVYIGADHDIPATFNNIRFQLPLGSYPNRTLQAQWNQYGPDAFTFTTLEELEHDKTNDARTDYTDDLATLLELWHEKLPAAQSIIYSKGKK